MIKTVYRHVFLLLALILAASVFAEAQRSGDGVWTEVDDSVSRAQSADEHSITSESYKAFRLNKTVLRAILSGAPEEVSNLGIESDTIMTLPMPDGTFARFRVEHSLVVEPALLEKYPELGQTYRGQGIDDPTATVRFDFLPSGFHSMILSRRGTIYVDPYAKGDTTNYVSYYKASLRRGMDRPACFFEDENSDFSSVTKSEYARSEMAPSMPFANMVSNGTQLRTYRLALAATREYTAAVGGGTVSGALAAQVLIMNRVNGVYEKDLAIRMVIVGNNNLIVHTAEPDPYTNNNGFTMLDENQVSVDALIGTANYDIGHVFSTAGGGVATLGSPCNASSKARGVSGLPNPTGDAFSIDFVSHEMGHQFGARHTFNGTTGNCSGNNRSASSAYEPGSGITVMGYAGICDAQDLANNSIDTFHVKSLEDIILFRESGGNCGAATATNNTPPMVSVVDGPIFNIPRLTPFTLTASGSDADGNSITYDWQEYDLGAQTSAVPNTDSDGARPIFRAYPPSSNPSRTFPSTQYIVNNGNAPPPVYGAGFMTGEMLPSIARTMTFQVIARDNRLNGGGIGTATATVNVDGNGPFSITSPTSGVLWNAGSTQTITWNVANTSAAPVNVANVKISLSTDGGQTYPIVLAASTANDGDETFPSPVLDTTQARIKIEPIGNIFFDVSDVNFAISSSPAVSGQIGGRISSATGRAISRINVILTDTITSETRIAITNGFGYYRFDDVPFGRNYIIIPQLKKGYRFSPLSIVRNHTSDAASVDFTGQN
ncbi:MAG: reprolysin-like metallopeptidase [Pyrinomonadaceae bacterium]